MANSIIPYGKQSISQQDIDAVSEVLQSEYLTQGPKVKEFEEAFAEYVGAKYAVAVSNGTTALHLCAMVLNVKPGDKVITTTITFSASANCVRYCGGEVIFADINPDTYLLDINEVEKLLKEDTANQIKGIIPVDFAGLSIDMEAFRALADRYGCWIIEDACHAPGAYFENSKGEKIKAGSGQYADLAIFSFHPVKHIAAGEGGMITTNDIVLYNQLMTLRTHGITRDQSVFANTTDMANGQDDSEMYPGWYMEMQSLGYNYRLSDIQAALGNSQLSRADDGIAIRRAIAKRYEEAFAGCDEIVGQSGSIAGHAYHLYVIEIDNRLGLYNHLCTQKIFVQIHYIPVHLMPYYKQFGWKSGDFPKAEKYYSRCLSLPMFPTLTDNEQEFVIKTVLGFLDR